MGLVFGINSNRAVEDILPVYKLFGLNGPIIAENGILAKLNNKTPTTLLSAYHLKKILQTKIKLEKETECFLKQKYGSKAKFMTVDTVKLLSKDMWKGKNGTVLILNNKFRKFTVSMHIVKMFNRRIIRTKKNQIPLLFI